MVNHHGRRTADIRGVSMSCYLGFKGEETQRQAIHCESMRTSAVLVTSGN